MGGWIKIGRNFMGRVWIRLNTNGLNGYTTMWGRDDYSIGLSFLLSLIKANTYNTHHHNHPVNHTHIHTHRLIDGINGSLIRRQFFVNWFWLRIAILDKLLEILKGGILLSLKHQMNPPKETAIEFNQFYIENIILHLTKLCLLFIFLEVTHWFPQLILFYSAW